MTNQYLSTSGVGLARAFDRFERATHAGASFTNLSSSDNTANAAPPNPAAKSFVS
jgi:hypothetical protein